MEPMKKPFCEVDGLFRPVWDRALDIQKIVALDSNKMPPIIVAITCLDTAQYVFWDCLSESFVDDLLDDSEKAIIEYESENDYYASEDLISQCRNHSFLTKNLCLFNQAVDAYRQESYDLAVVGFTAIIDSVLSEATQNTTYKPKERYDAVLQKLMIDENVEEEEFARFILFETFNATAESFYKTV